MKLVNNLISISNMAVLAEGFTIGLRAGIPGETLARVLRGSGANSQQLERRVPRWLDGDATTRFSISLADKDLCLALEFARQLRIPTPITGSARAVYAIMRSEGMEG